jgi:hypothetical protein
VKAQANTLVEALAEARLARSTRGRGPVVAAGEGTQVFDEFRGGNVYDRGSHFAAQDAPDLLVDDIRQFFSKVR